MLGLGIPEHVLVALEERLMRVHPGTVLPGDRLGHERRQEAETIGDVAHHEPEGGQSIGRGQCVGIAKVDFVLPVGHLVMGRLDFEPEVLEIVDDDPPDFFALINRREVEVPARIVGIERRISAGGLFKDEELGLDSGLHRVAHLLGLGDLTLESCPSAAVERFAVRRIDVAHQPRHPATLVLVRHQPERVEVGGEQHVGFFDPHEPLDRRSVEHDLTIEGLGNLMMGHLEILVGTEDVGELEAQKIDTETFCKFQNISLGGPGRVSGKFG